MSIDRADGTAAGADIALPYRAPYDWAALHGFLAARAIPGVETAEPGRYARTIAVDGRHGTVGVRASEAGGALTAAIRFPEARAIPGIAGRLRHLFDCGADPHTIAARLRTDPAVARLVAARPGLRVPGAWDGFELAVRGILGQQVSVTAATRLAGRLVAAFGAPLAGQGGPGLTHLFPAPEALVEADVSRVLNMPRARGAAIRAVAAATLAEPGLFAVGQGLEAAVARLKALPGIGDWTAHYIAMRALREPDALPAGDIGLLRALDTGTGRPTPRELLARAEAWRPFRAYAAMHLWAGDAEREAAKIAARVFAMSGGLPTQKLPSKSRDARGAGLGQGAAIAGAADAGQETEAMPIQDIERPQAHAGDTDDEARWAAFSAADKSADGSFVTAVKTTGIYCRPSCPAKRAKRENVRFYATCDEAEAAGFRACKRCRPNAASRDEVQAEAVARACRLIAEAETPPALDALAQAAGMSPYHFHRTFKRVTGVTPKAYAGAHRAGRVASGLRDARTVTEAVYDAGYNAASRFYAEAGERLGMSPTTYRQGGEGAAIRFAIGECSLGSILVAATKKGVCSIMMDDDPEALVRALQDRFPKAALTGGDAGFEALVAQVVGMADAPGRSVALPLDIHGTAFQQKVWEALKRIPAGTTATYTQVARAIGEPTAVRAVARACGANPVALAIPCHRVVRSDGSLSGYRWGVDRKRSLIDKESADAERA